MFEKLNVWRPERLSSWIIICLTIALFGYYKYSTWNFGFFKKLGVKGPKPYPFFGNILHLYRKGVSGFDLELKEKYGSVVGMFNLRDPFLFIYDIQILKQILIKDFNLFANHLNLQIVEPPLDKMILLLKDEHWRHVRSILSPTFSSGKLRKMSAQMNHCCETLCANLKQRAETGEVFDFRVLCGAFTMDTIASTAFGVEIDSHNDPENQFVKMANKVFNLRFSFPLLIYMVSPVLYKCLAYLGLSMTDKSVMQFFLSVIEKAVQQREKGSDHTDFLQLMINAHLEDPPKEDDDEPKDLTSTKIIRGLTNEELLAQGCLFFLAGFETTANTLSFFGYNMATNPDIQENLYKEIVEKFGDEDPTYDSIKGLTYLDMCFCETLRLYPPGPRTDRVASSDVTIDGLFIPKGMVIIVPIYALQNDPEYWEEPHVYNPERFAPSVRSKIDPLRFMPFGVGPRNCVGMRLAQLELKMAIVKMIQKFRFVTCKETQIPLKLLAFAMKGEKGVQIKVEERK